MPDDRAGGVITDTFDKPVHVIVAAGCDPDIGNGSTAVLLDRDTRYGLPMPAILDHRSRDREVQARSLVAVGPLVRQLLPRQGDLLLGDDRLPFGRCGRTLGLACLQPRVPRSGSRDHRGRHCNPTCGVHLLQPS